MLLKEIIRLNNIVKDSINNKLINNADICTKIIDEILLSEKDNLISIPFIKEQTNRTIEITLYKGELTNQYLLEAILSNEEDFTIKTYLEVLNKDLSIDKRYTNDIWSHDTWKMI